MHRDDPGKLAQARTADRVIRAPRGSERTAKSWLTEAPLRMLMNNLDPEVAERPAELVVYGGIGRAIEIARLESHVDSRSLALDRQQ